MRLLQEWLRACAPPAPLTVSQWADKHRQLSTESSAKSGQWESFAYQREPMDACSDPSIRRVVIKSATQMLKSAVAENVIGRAIDVDPGPILVLLPRKEDAREFGDDRIAPMLRDTPRLRTKAPLTAAGKSPKRFRGGRLIFTSAGSAANVAKNAIRYLICDEVDKYPLSAGDEGDPISLARKRMATYRHLAKELNCSSPTVEGSPIDRAYAQSDQREYYVPCPACGHEQTMMKRWHQVRWDSSLPTLEAQALSARYHCEKCDAAWDDAARWSAVDKGRWIAQALFNGIAGFWISELYSPFKQLWQIVLDFLLKKDSPEDYKTFVQTSLAENWVAQGEAPAWEVLLDRRERYAAGTVPAGGLLLTAGADVHPDRIEVEVVAWGRNHESWSVLYDIFEGRTSEIWAVGGQPGPWQKLEALLHEYFPREKGGDLAISRLFVDSGNQSNDVYQWVRMQPGGIVTAVKGVERADVPVSQPKPVDVTAWGKKLKHGMKIRLVATGFFKEQLYADLRKRRPTAEELAGGAVYPAGYCHFPDDRNYGDEHFKQLCAEQLVTVRDKRGRQRREWQQLRARNEALDCRVYARAAAWDVGVDRWKEPRWLEIEAGMPVTQTSFALSAPPSPAPATPAAVPAQRPAALPQFARQAPPIAASGWLGGRTTNWFGR